MTKYQIFVTANEFLKFISPENWRNEAKRNAIVLNNAGTHAKLFGKAITDYENQEFPEYISKIMVPLQISKARLNSIQKRTTTNYININAFCKACGVKYSISKVANDSVDNSDVEFSVERYGPHEFDKHDSANLKNNLISGKQREEISKQITSSQHNGSTSDYLAVQYQLHPNAQQPKEATFRKIVSQYENNGYNASINWIDNLISIATMAKNAELFCNEKSSKQFIRGYVQRLEIFPDFSMTLTTHQQMQALNSIQVEHRCLNSSATGRLVAIPARYQSYPPLYTYGTVATDMRDNEKNIQGRYFLLAETTTSRHDTVQISQIFLNLRANYLKCYPDEKKICSWFTTDYSWPTIHAALEQLNHETINEYSDRIYHLANGDRSADKDDKVLLISCANHTMHIFCESLKHKQLFKDDDVTEFAIKCFALMMNCKQLDEIKRIFNNLSICFTSKTNDPMCQEARKYLHSCKVDRKIQTNPTYYDKPETNDEADEIIKINTKFSADFNNIYNDVRHNLSNSIEYEANQLYAPEFVNFMLVQFMPYAGIWASFSLNLTSITRMTNEIAEKILKIKKQKHKNLKPANYILDTILEAKSTAIRFIKGQIVESAEEQESDQDSEQEFDVDQEFEDILNDSNEDYWDKISMNQHPQQEKLLTTSQKRTSVDVYQQDSCMYKKMRFNDA